MEPLAVLVRRADGGFQLSPVPDAVARQRDVHEGDWTPWSGWPVVRDWRDWTDRQFECLPTVVQACTSVVTEQATDTPPPFSPSRRGLLARLRARVRVGRSNKP